MERSRKPSYSWPLAIATTLAATINIDAYSQTPALTLEFSRQPLSQVADNVAPPSEQHLKRHSIPNAVATVQIAEDATTRSPASVTANESRTAASMQVVARPGSVSPVSVARKAKTHDATGVSLSTEPASAANELAVHANATTAAASVFLESRGVACRAASEWMPAKQLRQHATATQELYREGDECERQAANAIARFLQQQADHQQDVAAAIALRAYYVHSAIGEQFQLAKKSVAALEEQRERQLAIVEKGFAAAIDLTSLDREAITLRLQRLQLEQRSRQVTDSLNDAMRLKYDWLTSQTEPLEVRIQSIDADYLVQFALTHRSDLLAIQCLGTQINSGTAPLLASVVRSASGMVSLPLPKRCFVDRMLRREDNTELADNLKESIALTYEAQSNAIRRDVSEKSISLELAYKRITLSQETTATWRKRVEQLERVDELGNGRPADLVIAQSSLLAAQAMEVERRLEARMMEIALAEACGGLYCRCCNGLAWLITSR